MTILVATIIKYPFINKMNIYSNRPFNNIVHFSYRRVDEGKSGANDNSDKDKDISELVSKLNHPSANKHKKHRDQADLSWKLLNVLNSDNSNSFTVQNLSQDTTYEFYVRAHNIIGDGPKSAIVSATTRRAYTTAPLDPGDQDENAMASSSGKFLASVSAVLLTFLLNLSHTNFFTESTLKNDHTSSVLDTSTFDSSKLVGIIHPVHVTTSSPSSADEISEDSAGNGHNSSQVIQIQLSFKPNQNSTSKANSTSLANQTNKRPRYDQPQKSANSTEANDSGTVSSQLAYSLSIFAKSTSSPIYLSVYIASSLSLSLSIYLS